MPVYIIPTSTAEHLTEKLKRKGLKVILPLKNKDNKKRFPDGEVYVRLPFSFLQSCKSKNSKVVILHSGVPAPNKGLVELELILQILKDYKIKTEVCFSYFPYGMQDKIFKKGEINAAESLIKKLVNYYKVWKIYIIDPHFSQRKWFFKYKVSIVSVFGLLKNAVKKDFKSDVLFLASDMGAQKSFKISGFKKERKDSFCVKIKTPENLKKRIKGKVIVICDDIIETGGTFLFVYNECKKYKPKKIVAAVIHGVLFSGIVKVKKKYSKLYMANTICQKETNIDIADSIVKAIIN